MKRILAALSVALIVGAMGSPAFAQPSPVDDVGGVVVERPIPGVVERPAPGVARALPRVVGGQQLAATGLEVSTGVALATGLLLLGGASMVIARRKAAPQV